MLISTLIWQNRVRRLLNIKDWREKKPNIVSISYRVQDTAGVFCDNKLENTDVFIQEVVTEQTCQPWFTGFTNWLHITIDFVTAMWTDWLLDEIDKFFFHLLIYTLRRAVHWLILLVTDLLLPLEFFSFSLLMCVKKYFPNIDKWNLIASSFAKLSVLWMVVHQSLLYLLIFVKVTYIWK